MKTLQNNFTTPEQSKRLLELGVPAWTADCYYYEEGGVCSDSTPNVVPLGEVWTDESRDTMFSSYIDLPCWSVGRLIEIFDLCFDSQRAEAIGVQNDSWDFSEADGTMVEFIIAAFERCRKLNLLNFSKLED